MKGIYCLWGQIIHLCISVPLSNGLSSEAVYTQNVFSEYTSMDKGGNRVLGWSHDSWLFFYLIRVFEMWNCKKIQCVKMCFSVQWDQTRFWNTEISCISVFLRFPCFHNKLSYKTNHLCCYYFGRSWDMLSRS